MTTAWSEALDDYASWCRVAGQSAGTVKIRHSYLRRLAAVHPEPWSVTLDDLIAFLAASPSWRPQTRKAGRAAVRSFYSWALTVERTTQDPSRALPRVVVPPGRPRPAPAAVAARALGAPAQRDRLMALLALHAGLRRAEIARVHTRDVVDGILHVRGKGGRDRTVPLSAELATALSASAAGYVFPGNDHGHLSPDRVGRIVARLLGDGWTAHTLRHRFATTSYAVERDLLAVQKLLGHAKPETTAIYTEVPADALRRAVDAAAGSVVDLSRRRALRTVHGTYCAVYLGLHWLAVTSDEMSRLRRCDFDPVARVVHVGSRQVPVDDELAAAIGRFFARVDSQLGPQSSAGAMFRATSGEPMLPWAIDEHLAEHLAAM